MNSSEEYPGQNILISYLKKQNKQPSFYGFLISHRDVIFDSITTTNLKDLNNFWFSRFLLGVENFPDLKTKVRFFYFANSGAFTLSLIKSANSGGGIGYIINERSHHAKLLEIFWQEIIKEYKENLVMPTITTDKIPTTKDSSNAADINLITNFCYNILHELESKSNINLFYKLTKIIKNPMDIFTISSKLDNDEYTNGRALITKITKKKSISPFSTDARPNIEEFEKDMQLIFHNCYIYNDIDSKIYHLGKEIESVFIKIWAENTQKKEDIDLLTNKTKVLTEKNINQQKVELKRVHDDNDVDLSTDHIAKQIRILEQNKDDLVFKDVINNALYATLAYKNLVAGNIIPFIKNLKTSLLSRSQMSLSSMNEPVLQAIVEGLLPQKYRIPEFSLVMDGKKQKGSGRFGYLDIFVVKGVGDYNISLELKYVSLVGLIKKQKDKYSTNDLEDLDKTLEKENEELLMNRPYSFWSKEHNKMNQITISETLEKGINQLRSYMNIIAKGKPTDYYSSGIFDRRVKITKSNPNELKGFVILVIGFRRILWRPVGEVMSNYSYNKV
ncbi:hypothetical protein RclHR1_16440003 [Rhizophagus clarus]|uniref:Bromo domain-containing protein n=1 Tax=Rhizophagus clarus TaxID=94130 RepID=A0A2Z6QHT4_9GLOM|nr:hypothetical protein RclHR1_16440003 [Rhizophagus clarus]